MSLLKFYFTFRVSAVISISFCLTTQTFKRPFFRSDPVHWGPFRQHVYPLVSNKSHKIFCCIATQLLLLSWVCITWICVVLELCTGRMITSPVFGQYRLIVPSKELHCVPLSYISSSRNVLRPSVLYYTAVCCMVFWSNKFYCITLHCIVVYRHFCISHSIDHLNSVCIVIAVEKRFFYFKQSGFTRKPHILSSITLFSHLLFQRALGFKLVFQRSLMKTDAPS